MKPAVFTAIGECMLELSPRGDLWQMGVAGDSFNVAYYVRALIEDDAVAYVTALGDDAFSRRIETYLANVRIETDRIRRIAGRNPGLYAIALDGAERSFTYWRGESAARQLAEDAGWLATALSDTSTLYFSGITLAILDTASRARLVAALAERHRGGARIVFDPNYRPALWSSAAVARGAIEQACRIADVVLPTFSDEAALFGDRAPEETVDRIAGYGPAEVAVKNGSEPSLLRDHGRDSRVPAFVPEQLVDTTGAGDSFNAGYIAARHFGRAPEEAVRLGHAVAAQVVAGFGAIATFDRRRAMSLAGL